MVCDEFGFIQRYFANMNPHLQQQARDNGVVLGVGDDAALIKMDGTCAFTTDTLIEGVHFFPTFNAHLLGARSLDVNFSDLYAIGAYPQYVTLSLNIPDRFLDFDEFWTPYAEGFAECLEDHNCTLVGGNICHVQGKGAPLTISISAWGRTYKEGAALLRSGAKIGDYIMLTGTLGANGLYVKSTYNNTIRSIDISERQSFERHAFRYDPRMSQFVPLLLKYSSCGIDISDGLLGDLSHILVKSRVRAVVNYEALPIDPLAKVLSPQLRVSEKSLLKLALSSGGDYNLLFTVSPENKLLLEEEMKQHPEFRGFPITAIGEITEAHDDELGLTENDLATNGGLITIVDSKFQEINLRLGTGSYNHFVSSSGS